MLLFQSLCFLNQKSNKIVFIFIAQSVHRTLVVFRSAVKHGMGACSTHSTTDQGWVCTCDLLTTRLVLLPLTTGCLNQAKGSSTYSNPKLCRVKVRIRG